MSLAGHVSKKMMERYSHTQNARKREAIAVFNKPRVSVPQAEETAPMTQNSPQSETEKAGLVS
jgi:hypothetical protein